MVDFDGVPYSRSNCYLMGSKFSSACNIWYFLKALHSEE